LQGPGGKRSAHPHVLSDLQHWTKYGTQRLEHEDTSHVGPPASGGGGVGDGDGAWHALDWHVCPAGEQSWHALPPPPHASSVTPSRQVPLGSQQPLVQVCAHGRLRSSPPPPTMASGSSTIDAASVSAITSAASAASSVAVAASTASSFTPCVELSLAPSRPASFWRPTSAAERLPSSTPDLVSPGFAEFASVGGGPLPGSASGTKEVPPSDDAIASPSPARAHAPTSKSMAAQPKLVASGPCLLFSFFSGFAAPMTDLRPCEGHARAAARAR